MDDQIILFSEDNPDVSFSISLEVAKVSPTLSDMISDSVDREKKVPIPDTNSVILNIVVEYMKLLHEISTLEGVSEWKEKMIKSVPSPTLLQVMKLSEYLCLTTLSEEIAKIIAPRIQGKDLPAIRLELGVENDLTPEAEKALLDEYAWLFN